MKYKSIDEPLEFNEEFAREGDIYIYQGSRLIYMGSTISELPKPSLFCKIKNWLGKWNKKGGKE